MRASGTDASGGSSASLIAASSGSARLMGSATTRCRQLKLLLPLSTCQPLSVFSTARAVVPYMISRLASRAEANPWASRPMPARKLVMAGSPFVLSSPFLLASRLFFHNPRITDPESRSRARTPGITPSMASRSISPA